MKLSKRLDRIEQLVDRVLTAMYITIVVLLMLVVAYGTESLHWWTS